MDSIRETVFESLEWILRVPLLERLALFLIEPSICGLT